MIIILLNSYWFSIIRKTRYIPYSTPINVLTKLPPLMAGSILFNFVFPILILILILELEMYIWSSTILLLLSSADIPQYDYSVNPIISRVILNQLVALQIFALATSQSQHLLCIFVYGLFCLLSTNHLILYPLMTIPFIPYGPEITNGQPMRITVFTHHFLALSAYICFPMTNHFSGLIIALTLMLSNDIEKNPGPPGNLLKFMCWNLNSLPKDNFSRVKLIEAHNSIYNYDIIALCETSLTNEILVNVPELEGYTFISANHPSNQKRGGVSLYYKTSLPLIVRRDLSFNESLVVELKLDRKKIFFTVLYRSPSFTHFSPEFEGLLRNFEELHFKIIAENLYSFFFSGDLNGHSNQ